MKPRNPRTNHGKLNIFEKQTFVIFSKLPKISIFLSKKSKSLQGISMRFSDFFIVWYPPFNEVNFKMII